MREVCITISLSLLADGEGSAEHLGCFIQQWFDFKRKIHRTFGVFSLTGLNRAVCQRACAMNKIGNADQARFEITIDATVHVMASHDDLAGATISKGRTLYQQTVSRSAPTLQYLAACKKGS